MPETPASPRPQSPDPRGPARDRPERNRGALSRAIADHPALAFCVLAIGSTWLAQISSILLLGDITVGLVGELVVLLGSAVLVTAIAEGRPGLRRLFSGVIRWRAGVGWYVVALLGIGVLTILIALVTGTFQSPSSGWLAVTGVFFLQLVVLGALLGNIWEELGWTGVVQRRWMERYGLVAGGALTAIPFALIHLPMAFGSGFGVPLPVVLLIWGVLIVTAPILRWLIGVTYLGTGGSILIVGLLHASFNASGQLPVVVGGATFHSIGAAAVLLVIVWTYRAVRLRRAGQAERARLLPQVEPRPAA